MYMGTESSLFCSHIPQLNLVLSYMNQGCFLKPYSFNIYFNFVLSLQLRLTNLIPLQLSRLKFCEHF